MNNFCPSKKNKEGIIYESFIPILSVQQIYSQFGNVIYPYYSLDTVRTICRLSNEPIMCEVII